MTITATPTTGRLAARSPNLPMKNSYKNIALTRGGYRKKDERRKQNFAYWKALAENLDCF
jgi:hypothetical protein